MSDFEEQLRELINRYGLEKPSNTPDFILAQFLISCLNAWNKSTLQREEWYGKKTNEVKT